jgi:hypothetical protein
MELMGQDEYSGLWQGEIEQRELVRMSSDWEELLTSSEGLDASLHLQPLDSIIRRHDKKRSQHVHDIYCNACILI